ncbi:Chaperone protein DnaJ [Babesia sp. Xinjiang]|uniref:Chaperone protein DnaJ n=1 Tax=Babesia sp. Xinjiang TaxID=462227 RepID=UPI000A25A046|nr:Chaperone protein DnaJ [Babesia sp. Xinjiang]ORM40826.1 Chaperone protein DnaJ [Babesia sp. Xinjiang]
MVDSRRYMVTKVTDPVIGGGIAFLSVGMPCAVSSRSASRGRPNSTPIAPTLQGKLPSKVYSTLIAAIDTFDLDMGSGRLRRLALNACSNESETDVDYYKVLSLPIDCTDAEIKSRHEELKQSLKSLPSVDRCIAKKIKEAYKVLSNPASRALYDQKLKRKLSALPSPEDTDEQTDDDYNLDDSVELISEPDADYEIDVTEQDTSNQKHTGLTGFLGSLLGFNRDSGLKKVPAARTGDARTTVNVDLKNLVFGGTVKVMVDKLCNCPDCNSTKSSQQKYISRCAKCRGHGMISKSQRTPFGYISTSRTCTSCNGRGISRIQDCVRCNNTGRTQQQASVDLDIPAGTKEGSTFRIEVDTFCGPKQVVVPPGTQHGDEIAVGNYDGKAHLIEECGLKDINIETEIDDMIKRLVYIPVYNVRDVPALVVALDVYFKSKDTRALVIDSLLAKPGNMDDDIVETSLHLLHHLQKKHNLMVLYTKREECGFTVPFYVTLTHHPVFCEDDSTSSPVYFETPINNDCAADTLTLGLPVDWMTLEVDANRTGKIASGFVQPRPNRITEKTKASERHCFHGIDAAFGADISGEEATSHHGVTVCLLPGRRPLTEWHDYVGCIYKVTNQHRDKNIRLAELCEMDGRRTLLRVNCILNMSSGVELSEDGDLTLYSTLAMESDIVSTPDSFKNKTSTTDPSLRTVKTSATTRSPSRQNSKVFRPKRMSVDIDTLRKLRFGLFIINRDSSLRSQSFVLQG